MKDDIKIERFGNRLIAIKGVGKMFYQDGFPISIAVSEFRKNGVEVSILHVADECLKNGWSPKTTYNKLIADFQDDTDGNIYDINGIKEFCNGSYEDQREMIFEYLFGTPSNQTNEMAVKWLVDNIK